MEMLNEIAVVVPTYNNFDYVLQCLDSLKDVSIYLIDDHSTDIGIQIESQLKSRSVYYHRFQRNKGVTAAWNHALKCVKEKYCVLANSDTVFTGDWQWVMAKALEKVDVVGPVSNCPGNYRDHYSQSAFHWLEHYKEYEDPSETERRLRKYKHQIILRNEINGFMMAAETKTWLANSYDDDHVFNPKFKLLYSEVDFFKRMVGSVGVALDWFVYHHKGVSRDDYEVGRCVGDSRQSQTVDV